MNAEYAVAEDEQRSKAAGLFAPDSTKIYISKDIAKGFPMLDAALISYIGFHTHAETEGLTQLHHDEIWLVQKMALVAAHLELPVKTLEGVMKRLKNAGVLITEVIGNQRKLFWRLDIDNLLKRLSPLNTGNPFPQNEVMDTLKSRTWINKKNVRQNGESKDSPRQAEPGDGAFDSSIVENKAKLNVADKFGAKRPKEKVPPDEFIEYWNSLPHVPKSKSGSKAYEHCRAFFKAYQKYEIGSSKWHLPNEYKPKLAKINEITAHKKGNRPGMRSKEEMFEHIETAALAFHPEYLPQDKSRLKKLGLSNFLYNQYSKVSGQSSTFCQFVSKPPLRLDDTAEIIWERQEDYIRDIVRIISKIYNYANNKEPETELNAKELQSAIKIANNIAKEYVKIPIDEVAILAHHFRDYMAFMEWWENYMEDHIWSGMPITALDPSKDLWRRFVGFVSDDIGRDLFTGERVR